MTVRLLLSFTVSDSLPSTSGFPHGNALHGSTRQIESPPWQKEIAPVNVWPKTGHGRRQAAVGGRMGATQPMGQIENELHNETGVFRGVLEVRGGISRLAPDRLDLGVAGGFAQKVVQTHSKAGIGQLSLVVPRPGASGTISAQGSRFAFLEIFRLQQRRSVPGTGRLEDDSGFSTGFRCLF